MANINPVNYRALLADSPGMLAIHNPYAQSYTIRISVPRTIPASPIAAIDIRAYSRILPLEDSSALPNEQPMHELRVSLIPCKELLQRRGYNALHEIVECEGLGIGDHRHYTPQDGPLYDSQTRGCALPVYEERLCGDVRGAMNTLDALQQRLGIPPVTIAAAYEVLYALNAGFLEKNTVLQKKQLEKIAHRLDGAMPAKHNPPLSMN